MERISFKGVEIIWSLCWTNNFSGENIAFLQKYLPNADKRENALIKGKGQFSGKRKKWESQEKVSENGNWGDKAYIHTGNETKAKPKGKLELIQKIMFSGGGDKVGLMVFWEPTLGIH